MWWERSQAVGAARAVLWRSLAGPRAASSLNFSLPWVTRWPCGSKVGSEVHAIAFLMSWRSHGTMWVCGFESASSWPHLHFAAKNSHQTGLSLKIMTRVENHILVLRTTVFKNLIPSTLSCCILEFLGTSDFLSLASRAAGISCSCWVFLREGYWHRTPYHGGGKDGLDPQNH